MGVSVAKLCELPLFQENLKLVAGAEGLNNEVHYITVMEVPDFTDFKLSEGVFILTTFYAFQEDRERIDIVVEDLCKQKAVAIAVKAYRFIDTIPESIVKIADKYHVPLFVVEKKIYFREIISAVSSEIINCQWNTINGLNELNESFVRAILCREKMQSFIDIFGACVQCYCACLSLSGEILAQYFTQEMIDKQESAAIPTEEILQANRQLKNSSYFRAGEFLVFPCFTEGYPMGLFIYKPHEFVKTGETLYAKSIASFLSIKFLEGHLITEVEQRMTASIMNEILFSHCKEEAVIKDRLGLLRFTPLQNHFILLLTMRSKDKNDNLMILHNKFQNWAEQLRNLFQNIYVFPRGLDCVIFVSLPEKSRFLQEEAIKTALQQLLKLESLKTENLDLSYSLLTDDLRKLPECYEQAKKALCYGKAINEKSRIYPYSEYVEIGLIAHARGTNDNAILRQKILLPIWEYDKKFNTDLWSTLEKSLICSSLEQAAKELHIHTGTLRYRLQKIENITKADYFTPQGKFLLHLTYVLTKLEK